MSRKEKEEQERIDALQEEIRRIKLPRNGQVIGLLDRRLGGSRCYVRCMDGKTRNCRIPGRLKRSLWVREGDIILVEPWELEGDEKGDIVFKYSKAQVDMLNKRGHLKSLDGFSNF
jgi:translation initiation factor 1A